MRRMPYIPLKYKFASAVMMIVLGACSVFFFSTYKTTYQDKQLFIRDLNLATLDAALSAITFELKTRIDDIQAVIRRLYTQRNSANKDSQALFANLSPELEKEILGVTFFQESKGRGFRVIYQYTNQKLLKDESLPANLVNLITRTYPPTAEPAFQRDEITLLNRSVYVGQGESAKPYPVVTFLLNVIFADRRFERNIVAVDIRQDFLRKVLKRSEISELFLLTKAGKLLSHSSLEETVDNTKNIYEHPIVARLSAESNSNESLELVYDDEPYLFTLADTGFRDLYIVSQTKKSQAFLALETLVNRSLLLATGVIWVVVLLSVLFAGRLTVNIRKLKTAAEEVGAGKLDVKLNIRSNDELRDVSNSFKWMTQRITELISESVQKGRMEHELQTAKLVQSTLLAPPKLESESVQVAAHYSPMTECGGDFWDGWIVDNKLTLLVADATGHGASAAIATAVAKTTVETLNSNQEGRNMPCAETLTAFNRLMYATCKGSVLMTMSMLQIDLETGKVSLCSAGHEPPLRLPLTSGKAPRKKVEGDAPYLPEFLHARGERLGFAADSRYESVEYQLDPGDTILLYTDGITEAPNKKGKEWGERALKRSLAQLWKEPLAAIRDKIAEKVHTHIEGVGQNDDITFVLLKWMGPTPKTKQAA